MKPTEQNGMPPLSPEEADALVPTFQALVSRQMQFADQINEGIKTISSRTGQTPNSMESLEPAEQDNEEIRALKVRVKNTILDYESGWDEVQALGAVVKDPAQGSLDLWGRYEGRYVWLNWHYGEARIEFFHEADSNSRRPLPERRFTRLN